MLEFREGIKRLWKGTNHPSKMHVVGVNNNMVTKPFELKPGLDVQQYEIHHKNPQERSIIGALVDAPACGHMANQLFKRNIILMRNQPGVHQT